MKTISGLSVLICVSAFAQDHGRGNQNQGGHPAILVKRFDGPTAETSVQAGLWASEQLGRRGGLQR